MKFLDQAKIFIDQDMAAPAPSVSGARRMCRSADRTAVTAGAAAMVARAVAELVR